MVKMVDALEKSLAEDIQDLSWMSDETKKEAKVKLDAIRNKIGYPDVYRKLQFDRGQVRRSDWQHRPRQYFRIEAGHRQDR